MKYVYIVIDDYTPDAESTIYGAFATEKLAQKYIDEGIDEDYGKGHKTGDEYINRMTIDEE